MSKPFQLSTTYRSKLIIIKPFYQEQNSAC
ncbi:hypothetical protein [Shigella phage SfPhi01]|nr:hypothetical protein 101112UKE3-1_022 [Escherichia phage vB_EcoM-101112UKE3-1]BBI58197.1 hypothetical protein [Shigella phage SfPhi01]